MKTIKITPRPAHMLPEPCQECGEDGRFFLDMEFRQLKLCPICLDKAAETLRKAFSAWFKASH